MKRREFITLLGGAGTAWPALASTQQTMKRVGMLLPYPESDRVAKGRVQVFVRPDARSLRPSNLCRGHTQPPPM